MKHTVTPIPGDGIGPEVVVATRRVLEVTGVEFQWDVANAGAGHIRERGQSPTRAPL